MVVVHARLLRQYAALKDMVKMFEDESLYLLFPATYSVSYSAYSFRSRPFGRKLGRAEVEETVMVGSDAGGCR